MSEYIERDMVMKLVKLGYLVGNHNYSKVCKLIEDIPAADVVERKTGKWEIEICDDGYGAYNVYKCDQCGDLSAQPRNYCRECGARMVNND